ncbi:MAG: M28 family peptidase [Ardenticatenaceae bacterium]|nr:M28 family peptidase [Ardenticatenaceae bacterium]MCB8986228.1 M28 family peptidase [Ardenticatenaceae bacterium]
MTSPNPFLQLDRQMVGDVYTSSEVMDNLTILCDEFGSRFGGTPGEKQAADFMLAKLTEYGLQNVHLEPVDYIGWRRGEVKLQVISPIHKEIPCITLPHSPACQLEGTLIDMGDGAPEDFEARAADIKGKIVLTTSEVKPKGSSRWVHRMEKHGRALVAGATGFIFINHYPGYGPATGGIGHNGASLIPGISVALEDGAYLQRLIKQHGEVKIRLTSTDEIAPMVSWNVIGELPGQQHPEQFIMLGCHYDGHDISQGATDPASGTVALMEAARVLATYAADKLPITVRFALWGIEEIGLIGSTQYVAQHADELANLRFYLNMDMAGSLPNKGIVLNKWPELEPILAGWSAEMALPFGVEQSINAHSDHYPFLMAGVPTGGIGTVGGPARSGRGYAHTRYDTLDKTDMTSLREAAVLAARLAWRMANAAASGDWPARQRGRDVVAELLDNPDNKEEEAFFARLDAFYKQARAEGSQ